METHDENDDEFGNLLDEILKRTEKLERQLQNIIDQMSGSFYFESEEKDE